MPFEEDACKARPAEVRREGFPSRARRGINCQVPRRPPLPIVRPVLLGSLLLAAAGCVSADEKPDPPDAAPSSSADLRLPDDEPPPDRDAAVKLVDEGRALAKQGDHAAAFSAFEKARAADPSYGLAHLEGAISAQYVGVDDGTVRQRFERAAVLLADNPRLHYERAAFEESHGNAAEAVVLYRRALDLRPALTDARLALARALLTTGDLPAARETFRQVLEVEPTNVAALLGKADAAERLGDVDAAEGALRAVIEQLPEVASHRQRLIAFYERTGQTKKAERETRKLEKVEPKERRRLRQLKPSRKRR